MLSAHPYSRIMFGQYLLEEGIINQSVLYSALRTQNEDRMVKGTTRFLGEILLQDYHVFHDNRELRVKLSDLSKLNAP
ncbi:hypothetical protein ES703_34498 [subsurface metagenome]